MVRVLSQGRLDKLSTTPGFFVIYFPLVCFLASRIPLPNDESPSWMAWNIGLGLAALVFAPVAIFVLLIAAAVAGNNPAHASEARQIAMLINLGAVAVLLGPHMLSLLLRASDGFWSRLVPAVGKRHWLYFGLICFSLQILPLSVWWITSQLIPCIRSGPGTCW